MRVVSGAVAVATVAVAKAKPREKVLSPAASEPRKDAVTALTPGPFRPGMKYEMPSVVTTGEASMQYRSQRMPLISMTKSTHENRKERKGRRPRGRTSKTC